MIHVYPRFINYRPTPLHLRLNIVVIGFIFLFCGCSVYSLIPVTVKEIKTYAMGQEQSYTDPLNEVLAATVYNLQRSGFIVNRIEYFNEKGLVLASYEDLSVKLSLESMTPRMTKVVSKVHKDSISRQYSSEAEFFNNVRTSLESGQSLDWGTITRGMLKIYVSPDMNSEIIGFLGPGVEAGLIQETGDWAQIALMDRGTGYVLRKHLEPATTTKNQ